MAKYMEKPNYFEVEYITEDNLFKHQKKFNYTITRGTDNLIRVNNATLPAYAMEYSDGYKTVLSLREFERSYVPARGRIYPSGAPVRDR